MNSELNSKENNINRDIILHDEYNRLFLALEASEIGFWDWDLISGEIYCNEQCLSLLGYKPGEVVITRDFIMRITHPDEREEFIHTVANYIKNLIPVFKLEHRFMTKSGEYIWVMNSGRIVERDVYKKPIRIIGTTTNISLQIESRIKLKENEERYKSIFNHITEGFCRFNFKGEILEINQNLAKIIGVKEEQLLGSDLKNYFNSKDHKLLFSYFRHILENKAFTFETELISGKKKLIPVSISAQLISRNNTGIVQVLVRDFTDKKNYEKNLIEERNALNAILENSPYIICRYSRSLKFIYTSPNFKAITGIDSEFILGKKIAETDLFGNMSTFVEDKVKWVFRKGKGAKLNLTCSFPSRQKHFELAIMPEVGISGMYETVILTAMDITEKVEHEKELQYSKLILKEAEQNVHFGLFDFNLQQKSAVWSEETFQIFEHELGQEVPDFELYIQKYVHPDDVHIFHNLADENAKEILSFNHNYRILTDLGKIKYVNSVGNTNFDLTTGKIKSISGTIKDITEVKQIEDKLFAEKDLLQMVIDNLPDAIYIKNEQGFFIRGNNEMAKFVNLYDSEKLIGRTSFDIFPKNVAEEINNLEQLIFSKQQKIIKTERKYFYNGTSTWFSHTVIGISNLSGEVYEILGILKDITEYKTVEYALLDAKEKAEKADNLKSAFLANMSHEIRTPINGILGFANLMELKQFPRDKEIQYLQIINNSGKLLLNLINDIIDIAKIEAGQLNIDYSQVNLPALFTELLEFYLGEKHRKNKENIDVRINIPTNPIYHIFITDQYRLRQIINNLVSNSLKFCESGYIEMGYKPEGDHLLFYVKDTGIGICSEELSMVFDRFKQAGSSGKKKEGTGLGLAISKGLVELMKGEIGVNSDIDKGSEFYFKLPLVDIEKDWTDNNFSTFTFIQNCNWNEKTILLVEDEEVNYLYIKEMLQDTGVTLIHVPTGEEAVEICKTSVPIDVILMDMRLPGINGNIATRQIKKIRNDLPVIAQTAYAMENERKECLDAGCDFYIAKPFDQNLLFDVLKNFLFSEENFNKFQ
jgi:two-component system, chemotaxis family, CheB/CheR fusion protein